MRKVISLFMLCVLLCATVAFAQETVDLRTVRAPISAPNFGSRDGSCYLGLMIPDSIFYYWTWIPGEGFANYVDPAVDQPLGVDCTPPIYPFHITGVEAFIGLYGTRDLQIGQTMTVEVDIQCPASVGLYYADACNGPGPVVYSTQFNYTVTAYDWDSLAYVDLSVPVDYCVSGPFFYTVKLLTWTGAVSPTTEVPVFFSKGSAIPNQQCKVQWLSSRTIPWNGVNVRVPPCWLEVVNGFNPPVWGPWASWVFGASNDGCTPVACVPCTPTYPGDDVDHPINVNSATWTQTIDLPNFCQNYDQRYDDQILGGTFTANGPDVVLKISFPPEQPEACFRVTLTPACAEPTFFRIRSWMNDQYGTLYDGNPRFPAYNVAQVYDFTAAGLGCLTGGDYFLYIDARGCSCPVTVTYEGDQPLPVELTSFSATAASGKVTLTWQTRSEASVDHYVVTRNDNTTMLVNGLGDAAAGHLYTLVDDKVTNGTSYTYSLASVDVNGTVTHFDRTASATPMGDVVSDYALSQNYPNPFNPSTSIAYALKDAGMVSLKVYSLDGRLVTTLVSGKQEAGKYSISFDGSKLASGVYLYKLETNSFSAARKMVLMK